MSLRYSGRSGDAETRYSEGAVRVARPLLSRAVAIQLDAVPVRIVEVQSLADAMVRGAVERNARVDEPLQRIRERLPVGVADGGVVEARVAGRRR
jgi:hypothetical protein